MEYPALLANPAAEGWQRSCRAHTGVPLAGAPERLCRHRTKGRQSATSLRLCRIDTVTAAPEMAMAGGTQPEHLQAALSSVANWVKSRA